MSPLDDVRARIPEAAKDIKLNFQSVLEPGGGLSAAQRWGVAIAAAVASRSPELQRALVAEARAQKVDAATIDDAQAAAAIMAMNNVYYRFRHLVAQPGYRDLPARLRMNRLARPAASKLDFELFSLAVSAINGCETCIQSHEKVVRAGGLGEEQVHDAVRIAATIHASAVALEIEEYSHV